MKSAKGLNRCLEKLGLPNNDFISSQSIAFYQEITTKRNKEGEVSPGKVYSAEEEEKKGLKEKREMKLCFDMTMAILNYIVNVFIETKEGELRSKVEYQDNEEFNQYLDENNDVLTELQKKIPTFTKTYSRILFESDETTYKEELANYNDKK